MILLFVVSDAFLPYMRIRFGIGKSDRTLMNRIKVAFFAEILIEDFDGASRTMFQLIKRIDQERFEYLFICGVGPDTIRGFECVKVPVINLPVNAGYTMALPAMVKKNIKKRLKAFQPDVIHIATPSLLGTFALKFGRKHELPVITIYHTHFISYIDYYLKYTPILIDRVKQIIAENQRVFYNQCDMVYVPAGSIKKELEEMGVASSRMKIWKRGVDNELFSPGHADRELMKKLVGNDNPTVIFASRLVWEKNLETLFRIYDHMQRCGLAINLLIVGDGGAKRSCVQRMPKAIFTGKVSHQELSVLYASADLFLFPSVSEAYGNVVLEAMASGIPCVIANGGGSKDFIKDGFNGFKSEPYNENDYIDKMLLILNHPKLRNKFIFEGLQYTRHLSWNKLAYTYFTDLTSISRSSAPLAEA